MSENYLLQCMHTIWGNFFANLWIAAGYIDEIKYQQHKKVELADYSHVFSNKLL